MARKRDQSQDEVDELASEEVDELEELDEVDDVAPLPEVAQSEYDLIVMARALIAGPASNDDIWALLCASRPVAAKIGPTCERLLEGALGQAWRTLWQRGGTKPKPSHLGKRGRLWERYEPTDLAFSSQSLVLLRWLVTTPFSAPASTLKGLPATATLELGDQLLVYLTLDAARATPAMRVIANQPFVRAAPLAWLGFAHYFTSAKAPSFDSLLTGAGPILVEGLSDEIARRWHAGEVARRSLMDPEEILAVGAVQEAALNGFLDACDKHQRRDLAGFVIDAVQPLIQRNIIPVPSQLDPTAPLSVRANARISSGALLRALLRWSQWDQQHRGIRYIDDDYATAQVLLGRFEKIGSAGVARVEGWLSEMASLAPSSQDPAQP